jgi:DNA-binding protein H-NS
MQKFDLELMPIDELWALHEVISETLAARLAAEKLLLEERLDLLSNQANTSKRRPYPPVLPKFRNPRDAAETWSGRGKRPRWVTEQLALGKRMDDLKI